jgi:uncharacterized protein
MPLIAIPAQDIDNAGRQIEVDLPAAWLIRELSESEIDSAGPGHLAVRVSRSGTDIVVRGEATASVTMPCARCLTPTPLELRGELSLLLKAAPAAHMAGRRATPGAGTPAKERAGGAAAGPRDGEMWARAAARAMPDWGAAPKAGKAAPAQGAKASPSAKGGARKAKEPEYEFGAGEAELDTYDGETIVLDDFIREALILELPNFPLCSEACPGIRPVEPAAEAGSGSASDRIDPRLAPLSALREALGKGKAASGATSSAMNGATQGATQNATQGATKDPPKSPEKPAARAPAKKQKAKQSTGSAGTPSKPKKKTTKSNKE